MRRRSCDLSVSEKIGGAQGIKNTPPQKKEIRPVQLNGPHSKGCWVFIYTGRGQSSSIIQRLLRETQWGIRVFKAVRMKGRRVVTG